MQRAPESGLLGCKAGPPKVGFWGAKRAHSSAVRAAGS